MSTTRLGDVIVPEVYQGYMTLDGTELTRFFDSGIIVNNEVLNSRAAGPSQETNLPFWNDLDPDDTPDLSNDNPADKSTPTKLTSGKQMAQTAYLHKSWSTMSLVQHLAGSDPMQAILGMTNTYWARQFQRRLVSSCRGIYADNAANDDGDMAYDIAAPSGTPGDSNKIGGTAAIRAEMTLGDAVGGIGAMAVHSTVFGRMRELDLIDFVQPSAESGLIAATPMGNPMYQGKQLIVDDGMPVEVDGNDNTIYTSIMFGAGAFGYGNGSPDVPVAVARDETSGNGAGQDVLHERRHLLVHPFGFAFDVEAVGGQSASLTELATAGAWNRVVDRKLVPMAFLRTNG